MFVCFGASVLGEGGLFCDEHSLDVKSYKRFYCFIFSCLMVLQTACRWQRFEIFSWTLKLVLFVWMASRWCSDQSRITFTGIKKLSLAAWRANDKTSVFVAAWPNISNGLMDLHCWTLKHQELESSWKLAVTQFIKLWPLHQTGRRCVHLWYTVCPSPRCVIGYEWTSGVPVSFHKSELSF